MCVLLLHHRTRDDWPLVLLANRDESYDRPFEAPALRDEALGIVAPRDVRAGGTWFGFNRHGLVAAITNRRDAAENGARSRGLLVLDALRHADVEHATAWSLDHLARTPYPGFHLLLADGREASVVRNRHGGAQAIRLAPGAHVLTNLHELDELRVPPLGAPDGGEPIEATLARLERLATDTTPSLPGGHRILKREATRGTVCSVTMAAPRVGRPVLRFADGPPDRAPFQPVRIQENGIR